MSVEDTSIISMTGGTAIGIVFGASCFGMLWGLVNAILVNTIF